MIKNNVIIIIIIILLLLLLLPLIRIRIFNFEHFRLRLLPLRTDFIEILLQTETKSSYLKGRVKLYNTATCKELLALLYSMRT